MLKNILVEQVKNNSIFHSYIFEGDDDIVKNQYREFISYLLKTESEIENIVEIIKAEKTSIPISEIRDITKKVFEAPIDYEYRIIIIEDAHLMRVEAQNALLKTLEELPSYSIVIMTTDNRHKLLNTIISRSQVISLGIKSSDVDEELEQKIFSLIQKALMGNYYIINKEKDVFKDLAERKEDTLLIFTRIFSRLLDKSKKINGSYLNNRSIENILLKIEKIKSLLRVNINFQIAIEDLIFTIIEENNNNKKLMELRNEISQ